MDEINVNKKGRSSWIWILILLAVVGLVTWYRANNTGSIENSDVNRTYVPESNHPLTQRTLLPVPRT